MHLLAVAWLGSWICWSYLLVGVPALSLVSFISYGVDKRRASKTDGGNRIPEATLHMWDVFGGWPGGWIAQRFFRHKTVKTSFRVRFWASVVLNLFGNYVVYRTFFG